MKDMMIIPDICRKCHQHADGEKICHVEKFLHMTDCNVEFFHVTNCHGEKALHMRNVKQIFNVEKLCVQFMVFCRIKWF